MLRSILTAALRNLARNRLYAAISIFSLAIGMAAAILTFLFERDELTFDHFVPGYERIFVVQSRDVVPGRPPEVASTTASSLAAWMRLDFPEVRRAARYVKQWVYVKHGVSAIYEDVGWVDPDFFSIFRLKTLAGDPVATVRRPDGVVLTLSAARKYFGLDAPLGRTLHVQMVPAPDQVVPETLTVGAVIADLPGNSNIAVTMFASGLSPIAPERQDDAQPYVEGSIGAAEVRTYVQLADPAQVARVDARFPALIRRRMFPPPALSETPLGKTLAMSLTPIGRMHLMADQRPEMPPANLTTLAALISTAVLILVAAGLNFVNLATAVAARRAVEVGVRKVAGAGRGHLVLQFLGESLVYCAVSAVLAVALAEAALPALNTLLQRHVAFAYWRDPQLLGLVAGLVLLVGLLAGLYPAFVLSAFRPSTALKPDAAPSGGRQTWRGGLVLAQFALLVGLISSTVVIAEQTRFALGKGTGLDIDQVVVAGGPSCRGNFADRLQLIPGVRAVACSSRMALGRSDVADVIQTPAGRQLQVGLKPVDYGFFELYGVRPLAGRLASRAHGGDGTPQGLDTLPRATVVNQAMVRALGLASPQAAIDAMFNATTTPNHFEPLQIIGVIPDYAFDLTKGPVGAAFFPVVPAADADISIKIAADHIPQTLSAIDAAWKASGASIPLLRRFDAQYLNLIYASVISQAWLIGALAGVAVFIAAMGLFGMAAFTAERRTQEIGVRKAMGASTREILGLLLWSFAQPVLWANLIAWPIGWWAMHWWLQGFSQRVNLSPWCFLAAGGAALAIAALTVAGHALHIARAEPARALRYE